jgi:hypothetical protein
MANLLTFVGNEHHRVLNHLERLLPQVSDDPTRLKMRFYDFYRIADPQLRAERGAVYGYLRSKRLADEDALARLSEDGRRMELRLWQYYDDSRATPEWEPDLQSLYQQLEQHYHNVRATLERLRLSEVRTEDIDRIHEQYSRKRSEALIDIEQRAVHP